MNYLNLIGGIIGKFWRRNIANLIHKNKSMAWQDDQLKVAQIIQILLDTGIINLDEAIQLREKYKILIDEE